MHFFGKNFAEGSYQRISGDSFKARGDIAGVKPTFKIHGYLLLMGCTIIGSLAGYVFGGLVSQSPSLETIQIDTYRTSFVYNSSFSLPPSEQTDLAWNEFLPHDLGFVWNPSISPKVSGVAVFHALHCLHMLRVGYYDAMSNIGHSADNTSDHRDVIEHESAHIRHCFDYLRQSLMCAADSNLEPIDEKLGGVTGWGSPRVCRNYDNLVEWSLKWRNSSQVDTI